MTFAALCILRVAAMPKAPRLKLVPLESGPRAALGRELAAKSTVRALSSGHGFCLRFSKGGPMAPGHLCRTPQGLTMTAEEG